MGYFITYHWAWLAGAAAIGLGAGWIAVVQRATGLSKRSMQIVAALLAIAVVLAAARLLPGRFGYWLDLGLALLAVYLVGCAVGSWLRERVIWRSAPPS